MNKKLLIIGLIFLAGIGLTIRLVPHPANFTPVFAIALFAGFYLPKKWAIILPISVMLISDLFIGLYDWKLMSAVYGCIALAGLAGLIIRKNRQVSSVILTTLIVSISFFILTNLAVWLFSPWYAHSWSGLMLCYTLAVPFFKNTLMGNLFFVGVLFGGYEMIKVLATQRFKLLSVVKTK